jgi:hypothetical protein
MDRTNVGLADRVRLRGERPDIAERIQMADCFEMVLQRLAADRQSLFEDDRGLAAREGIAFDRVRALGQLDIVPVGDCGQAAPGQWRQRLRPRPLLGDPALNRRAGRH